MKVTMMLADSVQAIDGKLYILGGGWSLTGPEPVPSAIAVQFSVPWDQSDHKHSFKLELLDADGNSIDNDEGQPIVAEGTFETGRPPGHKRGTPLGSSLAVNLPPLSLQPDSRFEWRLTVNDELRDEWRLPFTTRPALPSTGTPPGFQGQ